jgi:ribosome-associated protein
MLRRGNRHLRFCLGSRPPIENWASPRSRLRRTVLKKKELLKTSIVVPENAVASVTMIPITEGNFRMFPAHSEILTITERIRVRCGEFAWGVARSSGPGGQNVNKVNSKVTLRWPIFESVGLPNDVRERFAVAYRRRLTIEGDLLISSERYRDQLKNVSDCLDKLSALLLSVAKGPKPRKKKNPTKASTRRRLADKRLNSETKQRRQLPKIED